MEKTKSEPVVIGGDMDEGVKGLHDKNLQIGHGAGTTKSAERTTENNYGIPRYTYVVYWSERHKTWVAMAREQEGLVKTGRSAFDALNQLECELIKRSDHIELPPRMRLTAQEVFEFCVEGKGGDAV